MSVIFHWI